LRAGYLSGGEQQMLAIGRALLGKPALMLLDEPSLGLAPLVVQGIFEIIARINREQGVAMLLVEQNAMAAFEIAQYGYIMESGKVVIDGPTDKLVRDPDVQRFYLGYGDGSEELASFRHVKHYKRRKRWLS
jgi:branched-chain amino acid transport system ATP-binding protein